MSKGQDDHVVKPSGSARQSGCVQHRFLNDPTALQVTTPHEQRYPSTNLTKNRLSSAALLPPTMVICLPL